MGSLTNISDANRQSLLTAAGETPARSVERSVDGLAQFSPGEVPRKPQSVATGGSERQNVTVPAGKLITWLADISVNGGFRDFNPTSPLLTGIEGSGSTTVTNAKSILDSNGPSAMVSWVKQQRSVLITDTTMESAQTSLLGGKCRTADLVRGASIASRVLAKAFSLECWGGDSFRTCYQELREDPWARLRALRVAAPNVCLQMELAGACLVGKRPCPVSLTQPQRTVRRL